MKLFVYAGNELLAQITLVEDILTPLRHNLWNVRNIRKNGHSPLGYFSLEVTGETSGLSTYSCNSGCVLSEIQRTAKNGFFDPSNMV